MTSLAFLSALGSGMVAGVFFAFSAFIMAGLARLPAPQGIAAMQSINITVINPVFMAVFLGTAVLSAAMIVLALLNWSDPRAVKLLAGGLLYLYGPYLQQGVLTAPSNVAFNADLRLRDPAWGLRELDDVEECAL